MSKLYLRKNEERRILNGHQWIFSNEIDRTENTIETGGLVEVYSSAGSKIGTGFYNKHSLIAVRMFKHSFSGDLEGYFKKLMLNAYNYRKRIYPNRNSYRLINSESDYMPGLIIDKYNDTYVLQVYCYGMQKNIAHIIDVLKTDLRATNIFSRNEPYLRKLEGLPEQYELFLGEIGSEIINDGKISYKIDFVNSQKTGFYFDQCDNREFIEKFAGGSAVLDAFCNCGGFGMHAAYAGAKSVTFVESSKTEIVNAKSNYRLNSLQTQAEFVESDVFDYLEKCVLENKKFDVVIIDPPAFAKSKRNIPSALKGYAKLNKLAFSCVDENGFLVSSSCSYHVGESDFLDVISQAARKSGKTAQLIYINSASMDHPQLPEMEETKYLKFMVFRVS